MSALQDINFNQDPLESPEAVEGGANPTAQDTAAVINGLRLKNHELQKTKFQALAQVKALEDQVNLAAQHNKLTNDAALTHYDRNLSLELDQAIKKQTVALEEGDMESAAKFSLEAGQLSNKIEEVKQYHMERESAQMMSQQLQDYGTPPAYPPYAAAPVPSIPPVAAQWAQNNPWSIPGSPYYDAAKADIVSGWERNQIENLNRMGRGNEVGSPQYFQALDNFVKNNISRSHQPMSFRAPQANMAAPSRGRPNPYGNSRGPNPNAIDLDPREKNMAHKMGIKLDDWAKFKVQGMQHNKIRQDDTYGRTNQRY